MLPYHLPSWPRITAAGVSIDVDKIRKNITNFFIFLFIKKIGLLSPIAGYEIQPYSIVVGDYLI
jgi:hypothetical protein